PDCVQEALAVERPSILRQAVAFAFEIGDLPELAGLEVLCKKLAVAGESDLFAVWRELRRALGGLGAGQTEGRLGAVGTDHVEIAAIGEGRTAAVAGDVEVGQTFRGRKELVAPIVLLGGAAGERIFFGFQSRQTPQSTRLGVI